MISTAAGGWKRPQRAAPTLPHPPPFVAAEAVARRPSAPPARPAPAPAAAPEPVHVGREAASVASFGPGDDPGASVHVEPPWAGYEVQAASDIVARVRGADEATKAVALLYEQQHKRPLHDPARRRGPDRACYLDDVMSRHMGAAKAVPAPAVVCSMHLRRTQHTTPWRK